MRAMLSLLLLSAAVLSCPSAIGQPENNVRNTAVPAANPEKVFAAGSRWESNAMASTLDNYAGTTYAPDLSFRLSYEGKSYRVQTRKLNDRGIPAIYEVVSVQRLNGPSSRSSRHE
jgi:hypothetical protein